MKSTELKRKISEKFGIPVKDLKVRNDHMWKHVYIRENAGHEGDSYREVENKIEAFISTNDDEVSTYIRDDGYDTECNRIMVDFNSYWFNN